MKNKAVSKLLIWFFKAFAAGVVSLAVLSLVAFFYNYTGIHITNTTQSTDYTWMPYQRMNNMKEGFASVFMDKNGFNNTVECGENIDILLMGSSHMEAYQVAQNRNCGFLLNEKMPEYCTYNIGISGHTIYRIADNIDNALKEYTPSKYVVIETNTVQLDINMMNKVIKGNTTAIKSHDSGILFYLQKIPAFKPLYNQFDNWLKIKSNSNNDNDELTENIIDKEYPSALMKFLEIIKNEAQKQGVIPVVFYAPNEYLTKNGELLFQTDQEYLEIYKEICKKSGIIFIDMSESFAELYTEKKVLAHGFANTAVGTGHLNEHGHKAVAETLIDEIRKMEGR